MSDTNVIHIKSNNMDELQAAIQSLTSSNLFNLYQKESNNKYLDNLLDYLRTYYKQLETSIIDPYDSPDFKVNIFNSLEQLLYQVSSIHSKELRDKNLRTVHDWFTNRYTYYQEMLSFDSRSSSDPTQLYTSLELGKLPDLDIGKEEKYSIEELQKHHSLFENALQSPKELLKSFTVKRVDKNKGKINDVSIGERLGKSYNDYDEGKGYDYANDEGIDGNNNNNNEQVELPKIYTFTPEQLGLGSTCNSTHVTYSNLDLNQLNELRSSYSFYRPEYNFSHLYYDKLIAKSKHGEIAERRAKEEINEIIHEYGFKKSSMNKTNTYRQSLRELVHHYKKQMAPIEEDKEKDKPKEDQKPSPSSSSLNVNAAKVNNFTQYQSRFHKSSSQIISNNKGSLPMNNNLRKQSIVAFKGGLTPRGSKAFSPLMPNGNNFKGRMSYQKMDYCFSLNNTTTTNINKVITSKIANVVNNKIIEPAEDHKEKTYSINLHINPITSLNTNYITNKVINEEMPVDFICQGMNKDPIATKRLAYEALLDLKRINNVKTGYEKHYDPLSKYDMINSSIINKSKSTGSLSGRNDAKLSPRNGYEYSKMQRNNNDYLTLRMTMNHYKPREVDMLCSTMRINGINKLNKNTLKGAFMFPKNTTALPNCYLPHAGYGLLKIPDGFYAAKGKSRKK